MVLTCHSYILRLESYMSTSSKLTNFNSTELGRTVWESVEAH